MGKCGHRAHSKDEERAFVSVSAAILAVSDSRSLQDDKSGDMISEKLTDAGHKVKERKICRDETREIQKEVLNWVCGDEIDFIIVTGGTGVTERDVTPEAVASLYTKSIPGFGELFRFLSYDEIGTSSIQSRADAGVIQGTIVFLLPGSRGAVTLAMDKIILPQLDIRHRPCNFTELLPRIKNDQG